MSNIRNTKKYKQYKTEFMKRIEDGRIEKIKCVHPNISFIAKVESYESSYEIFPVPYEFDVYSDEEKDFPEIEKIKNIFDSFFCEDLDTSIMELVLEDLGLKPVGETIEILYS